jgi:hypothetical protein
VKSGLIKEWGGSLHQTFRLSPEVDSSENSRHLSGNLRPFLEADGLTPDELLARLPYDKQRSRDRNRETPDPKRYRDAKQVYQTVGLIYEDKGKVCVTDLGCAVRRWLLIITSKNQIILARHAAYALAACQLRNPTGAGQKYAPTVEVFPFAYIWRAMLALDNRLSSEELNRSIFKVTNEIELHTAIEAIRRTRPEAHGKKKETVTQSNSLGPETITEAAKNDRIIPWLSLASFGWTLFPDKRGGKDGRYYELDATTLPIIKDAARFQHRHRNFASTKEYVEHISACAALPKDLR